MVVRPFQLETRGEWSAWCQSTLRPANVPVDPDVVYAQSGWQGWAHWLTACEPDSVLTAPVFLPFKHALTVARSLGLKSQHGWVMWCKSGDRPAAIPEYPSRTYKDSGWQTWGHWLGTDRAQRGQAAL